MGAKVRWPACTQCSARCGGEGEGSELQESTSGEGIGCAQREKAWGQDAEPSHPKLASLFHNRSTAMSVPIQAVAEGALQYIIY